MATTISTLAYKIVADTQSFTSGITATRREMTAAKRIIEETRNPTQKLGDAIAGLDALFKKGLLTQTQYEKAMKGVKSELKEQAVDAEVLESKTSKMTKAIAASVASYFTFQAAIRIVNSELREQSRLHEEASRVQMTAADAQAEVIKNLGKISTSEASSFLTKLEELSVAGGMASVAPVYTAAASTLSATGGNQQLTQAILQQAIPLFRNRPAELGDFAGAVGDLAGIAGVTSAEDIKKMIGLVMSTQSLARITSLDAFKNAAPAIAAVAASDTGGDRMRAIREGGAAFAAIGGAIKDPEGALTKTAVSNLSGKLAELLPAKDIIGLEGNVVRRGTGMTGFGQRLAAVQSSETLQREFMQGSDSFQKASFRGPIIPVIRQLLTDNQSEAAIRFADAMTSIKPDSSFVDQVVTNLDKATPQLAASKFSQAVSGLIEQDQLSAGPAGTIRGRLVEGLERTYPGMGGLVRRNVMMQAFDTAVGSGVTPEFAAKSVLLAQKQRAERGSFLGMNADTAGALFGALTGQTVAGSLVPGFQTEEQKKDVALLEKILVELEKFNSRDTLEVEEVEME